MNLTPKQKRKVMALCRHMLNDGKVLVKDKFDYTVKQSNITALSADYTVTLSDTVHREYSVDNVTIIPINVIDVVK